MCGRYQLATKPRKLAEAFDAILRLDASMVERYNVAPTQPMPVVRMGDHGRELVPMRWGLVPAWMKPKGDKMPAGWINARADTAAIKPAFRAAFHRRRCLVPATGFYEWQKRDDGPKQPFLIRRADDPLLAFAGLWETWASPDGSEVDTYTILTTEPNETIRTIHDRMPVILESKEYDAWLDAGRGDAADLLGPLPDGLLDLVPISTRINSPRNMGPEAVEILDS